MVVLNPEKPFYMQFCSHLAQVIRIVNLFFLVICLAGAQAQTPKNKYALKGIKKANAGKYEAAIKLFTKALKQEPTDYYLRYDRAIAHLMMSNPENALTDLDTMLQQAPDFYKGRLVRAMVRNDLTNYEGALSDLNYCIVLNAGNGEAYFRKGMLLQSLGKRDSACREFEIARQLGYQKADRKAEKCKDTSTTGKSYPMIRLQKTSEDPTYGFSQANPIKVGKDDEGGPGNSYRYLELLRDALGKPVKFYRSGSCCPYPSENGFNGTALLDNYVLTYFDADGRKKTTSVFITFYEYEEPKIISGFKTIDLK